MALRLFSHECGGAKVVVGTCAAARGGRGRSVGPLLASRSALYAALVARARDLTQKSRNGMTLQRAGHFELHAEVDDGDVSLSSRPAPIASWENPSGKKRCSACAPYRTAGERHIT